MRQKIFNLFPNIEDALSLEPEILAGLIISDLNERVDSNEQNNFNRSNYSNEVMEGYTCEYKRKEELRLVSLEAWQWLENIGLLAIRHDSDNKWEFVTRRGRRIKKPDDLKYFQRSSVLSKDVLHPILSSKVWSLFVGGDFDTAVFQAFKQVEVRVREAGCFSPKDIGTELMWKAFEVENGPLTDKSLVKAEREAIRNLFAGAIGYQKNAHSHRNVGLADPAVAAELILFANHLLRIVDSHRNVP